MLMSDMSDSWLTKNEFDKFILRHNITTLGLLYDSVIDMHGHMSYITHVICLTEVGVVRTDLSVNSWNEEKFRTT